MKINTNKITFKYLQWLYGWNEYELPVSLCQYFWKLMWGLICLPFSFIPFFLKKKYLDIWQIFPLLLGLILLLGFATYDKYFGFTFNLLLAIPLASLIMTTLLVIVLLIIFFILRTMENLIHPKQYIISEFIKAKKQKICPLIEYIDEEDSKAG